MMKNQKLFWVNLIISFFLISCGGSDVSDPVSKPYPTPTPEPNPSVTIPETESPQAQGATYWWNEAVFYEIFVRSFYDSDGDGIGDINGIREKLDYLQNDLGATALWLMPINPSPSYHGYDVTDYKAINPDYGTMQDFRSLVQELHSRGMKIVIDYVINHTSDQHPWFQSAYNDKKSTYRDWYIFVNPKPTYTGSWGQGVWHGEAPNYYYGVFSYVMPDLNYNTQAVKDEIKETSTYWLTEVGVDGFRLDAAKHLIEEGEIQDNTDATLTYWKEFTANMKSDKNDAITIAEVIDGSQVIVKYINNGIDLGFEFDLAGTILNAVKKNSPQALKSKLAEIRDLYPYHQYATFLSNHDQDRSYETMGKSIANSKLAASILLTLPGTPFIYYGEEIGMWGTKAGGDEYIRTPLHWTSDATTAGFTTGTPWWSIIGDQETKNVATQKEEDTSLLNTYAQLIALRKSHPQFTKGTFQTLGVSSASIYGYLREFKGKAVIVAHNFSNNEISSPKIYAKKTNLPEGTYKVKDFISGSYLENVKLNEDGGFLFQPIERIGKKETKVLLIEQ
ncbi:glycosidase [Balneicella halophila]|uniref:Alpha-amylase n=1 Tax=Balneicella halophila TaxID=1537566 RepID=A0A7L4URB0_BALHA|nr:alpha-amylase family glycosyl hydrolase [Balneicella halophila]PVX51767.1 glycosidase [Balneicella halophila]